MTTNRYAAAMPTIVPNTINTRYTAHEPKPLFEEGRDGPVVDTGVAFVLFNPGSTHGEGRIVEVFPVPFRLPLTPKFGVPLDPCTTVGVGDGDGTCVGVGVAGA